MDTLPKDGEVTLGIYDQQGQLLRTVISAESRSQGRLSETWDGLDQWGKPISARFVCFEGTVPSNHHHPLCYDLWKSGEPAVADHRWQGRLAE